VSNLITFSENLFSLTYWKIRESTKKYNIIRGGSASSKSYSTYQLAIQWLLTEKSDILAVRKIGNDLQDSIFNGIINIIKEWNILNLFSISQAPGGRTIKFNRTGAKIVFKGLDDPEKLKSIVNIGRIIIEEANQLEEEDFEELNRRARGIENIQIYLLFNPISYEHWIYKRFVVSDIFKDETELFHFTYQDAVNRKGKSFITENDMKNLERYKEYSDYDYKVYCLGEWGNIIHGGEYYAQFKYSNIIRDIVFNPESPIHFSTDQNVMPYISASLWQIEKTETMYYCRCFDELILKNPRNTTEALCDELLYRYEPKGFFYYGDASGKKRDTRANENDYEIIERKLRKYLNNNSNRIPYSNPSHNKRRKFINNIFVGGFYPIVIEIDSKCTELIKDLENVIVDVDGSKLKKKVTDKNTGQSYEPLGHLSDTLDYFISYAFSQYFD
jgi:phage terminase large subunit